MAGMKKRADGRYLIQVQIGWDSNGKKKYKNIYGKTIKETEQKAAEFRAKKENGLLVDDSGLTVEQWATQWLATYKSGVSRSTQTMYKGAITNHIVPSIGQVKLKAVKQIHLQNLLNEMFQNGYSKRMISIVNLTLSQMFEMAVMNNILAVSPANHLKVEGTPPKTRDALTAEEQSRLIEHSGSDREGMYVKILYYFGLRRGEALALVKSDFDFKQGMLRINKSIEYHGNQPTVKTPKTEAGYRDVPIPKVFAPQLKSYFFTLPGLTIFPGKNGAAMTYAEFTWMWKRIEKRVGLETHMTPHVLRHTYATILYDLGVDIKTAQKYLGHADPMVTLKIYTHLSQQKERISAEKITNWGFEGSKD